MEKYRRMIENASSIEEIDSIIEKAARDFTLPTKVYCKLYDIALKKAQSENTI